jgi:transcriptional regulator with XRE-family HTH domain
MTDNQLDKLRSRTIHARKLLDLNQKDLADQAGLTQTQISRFENGAVQEPDFSMVMAIIKALGFDINDFLYSEDSYFIQLLNQKILEPENQDNQTDLREDFSAKSQDKYFIAWGSESLKTEPGKSKHGILNNTQTVFAKKYFSGSTAKNHILINGDSNETKRKLVERCLSAVHSKKIILSSQPNSADHWKKVLRENQKSFHICTLDQLHFDPQENTDDHQWEEANLALAAVLEADPDDWDIYLNDDRTDVCATIDQRIINIKYNHLLANSGLITELKPKSTPPWMFENSEQADCLLIDLYQPGWNGRQMSALAMQLILADLLNRADLDNTTIVLDDFDLIHNSDYVASENTSKFIARKITEMNSTSNILAVGTLTPDFANNIGWEDIFKTVLFTSSDKPDNAKALNRFVDGDSIANMYGVSLIPRKQVMIVFKNEACWDYGSLRVILDDSDLEWDQLDKSQKESFLKKNPEIKEKPGFEIN